MSEPVESIVEYISRIEEIKIKSENKGNKSELLFRGQREDLPLLPKLARLKLNGNLLDVEKLILEEFKRSCSSFTEIQPDNNWDLLALAQHHGLPTRLLDWSYSALVALWFAVQKEPEEHQGLKKNGVVWVLCPEVEDFRDTSKDEDPLSNKITKIFRSRVMSKRISAQSGVFTIHKVMEENKLISLEKNKVFKKGLMKIIISAEFFPSIRKSLSMLGTNDAQIFPDMDGLCRYLERRFSKLNDEG